MSPCLPCIVRTSPLLPPLPDVKKARLKHALHLPAIRRTRARALHNATMLGLILDIICWNVRGLNDRACKDTIHAMLAQTTCHIACIQETKLNFIDHQTMGYIGGFQLRSFAHHPATSTRGGIMLLWDEDHVTISNIHIGTHLISADVSIRSCGTSFKITMVYGPSNDADKRNFLDEAIAAKPTDDDTKWLILGHFNLMYQAVDKNNGNVNLCLMGQFRQALNSCQLKELRLLNRKYTWNNEREDPTLVRLDRAFCNAN
uniref:Uncharacterized protein n=1 Tax=Avena sativa TaxID=4498 RepID=A0ACD5UR25_AVESA